MEEVEEGREEKRVGGRRGKGENGWNGRLFIGWKLGHPLRHKLGALALRPTSLSVHRAITEALVKCVGGSPHVNITHSAARALKARRLNTIILIFDMNFGKASTPVLTIGEVQRHGIVFV